MTGDETLIKEIALKAAREAVVELMDEALRKAADEAARRAAPDKSEIESIVRQAVTRTMIELGVRSDDPFEMQKDMGHLRASRVRDELLRQRGMLFLLTAIGSSVLAALWVGAQRLLSGGGPGN